MEKTLAILWMVSATVNLAAFFANRDTDKLIIASMAILLAIFNWEKYKNR